MRSCVLNQLRKFTLIYCGLISLTISLWAFGGVDEVYYTPENTGLQSTDFSVMLQEVFIAVENCWQI